MECLLSYHTDAGIVKKVNQDALLIQQGRWRGEQITLAVLCDGMGGLKKGEAASASVIRRFARWFRQDFPILLRWDMEKNIRKEWQQNLEHGAEGLGAGILSEWTDLLAQEHEAIGAYGQSRGISVGTTATAMLLLGDTYYIAHVGDCRIYELSDGIRQLTRDQTLAQQELERGRLTAGDAKRDSRRNILLQSVGAGAGPKPDHIWGTVCKDSVYLLCSDGFRHKVTAEELFRAFAPSAMTGEAEMEAVCAEMTALNKDRGERDNISVIAVKVV